MVSRKVGLLLVAGLTLSCCIGLCLSILHLGLKTQGGPPTEFRGLDSPIFVDGDGDLTGYPGNGSKSDPYRIENLTIDGGAGSYCIWVQDTTVHFLVRNCTVFNATSGIILKNVTAGLSVVNGCTAYDTTYGIDLTTVLNCTLVNNVAYANLIGIALTGVNYTTLFNNTASNNVKGENGDGIELGYSWFNDILNNTLNNNKNTGILFLYSHYNTIRWNTILGNRIPWEEYGSSNNIFEDNIAEWPDEIGGFQLSLSLLSLIALTIVTIRERRKL